MPPNLRLIFWGGAWVGWRRKCAVVVVVVVVVVVCVCEGGAGRGTVPSNLGLIFWGLYDTLSFGTPMSDSFSSTLPIFSSIS